ncbi:MAG: STT3 domain-containing protein [Nanoarchaeota archaeon]
MSELEKRKEAVLEKLKQVTSKPIYLIYLVLGIIVSWGVYIRTRNLSIINWQYPIDPDSFAFLRYAKYIAEHGHLMDIDMLRYYPIGWSNLSEFRVLSYFIAYLYKFLNFLMPSVTIENADVLYPVICFAGGAIFFFLFMKKLFNWKIGLVSTGFLIVLPAYLYRTMAGAADKEAFATMMMFAALYFFLYAWKSSTTRQAIIYGTLAGLLTALTGAVWGGVMFLFLIFATFTLINVILGQMNKRTTLTYILWFIIMVISINSLYPERFYLTNFISSIQSTATTFVFFTVIVYYLLSKKPEITRKLVGLTKKKLPLGFIAPLLVFLIGLIALTLFSGPEKVIYQITQGYIQLTEPFGTNRWVLTVAEAHLPSFSDWKGQFTQKYLLIVLAGATLAFYTMTKVFKTKRIIPTIIFALALVGISISRYSPSSPLLNGSTGIALLIYFGSLLLICGMFFYAYFKFFSKDKQSFELLQKIDKSALLAIIILLYLMISAKTAIRLLFIFAPATAIFAGYFTIETLDRLKKINNDTYKIIGYVILIVLISTTWWGFSEASMNQARYTGSSYTYQWVQSMNWVRENTPEDAVFAHWWDYGYYVQTGGERATLSDGGNSRGAINYFTGRHLLTGQNETEALEILKANNATHFLVVYEEIGKYPAFSSIGSDVNYDRYSWISTFQLDPSLVQETRNETVLIFTGSTAIDEDFIYQDQLFPNGGAGIGGVMIPIETNTVMEGNASQTTQEIKQPAILLVYAGQQYQIPLECVFIDGEERVFPQKGYPGCFRVMPSIDGANQVNPLGAGLLLSPKVRRTVFTKLFLYDQPSEYFTKVYTDENTGMPLALYQGRLIGPLKIWEISYPDDLVIPEEYYGTEEPEGVTAVGKKFA